jgi:hypothetical protein
MKQTVNNMRTKTLLLSALLGSLASVSVMAQTNVYSLNAVGYINLTLQPGFNIITVPLLASPDNTIGTVLNNANGSLTGNNVYFYNNATGLYSEDSARPVGTARGNTSNANGWANNGTNVASPGIGFWFQNSTASAITVTFVGTVPSGPITNTLVAGFNLVGSVVPLPANADIVSNSLSSFTTYNIGDDVYTFDPTQPPASQYTEYASASGRGGGFGYLGQWQSPGDPIIPNVGQGFWYRNNNGATVNWVENYSVGQ